MARLAVAALLAALAAVPALAAGESDPPIARRALQCGSVTTRNGGSAVYINTIRANCTTARRVARKATGKRRYSAGGFSCRRGKRSPGLSGPSYACKNGRRSIGFIYRAP